MATAEYKAEVGEKEKIMSRLIERLQFNKNQRIFKLNKRQP
jgi:hypothetical protein